MVCSEENELGRGSYGEVFQGINTKTQEGVAVKRVHTSVPKQKRELEAMKSIHHENIVRLLYSEYRTPYMFLVMELCDNDLNNFLLDITIPLTLCVKFMQNIAQAINHLHNEVNILHRDIKPTNTLVQQDEVSGYILKLSDFGLAKRIPQSSAPITNTAHVGTRGWEAPETLTLVKDTKTTCHYGRPADVFSSGLEILSMVTHQPGEALQPITGM